MRFEGEYSVRLEEKGRVLDNFHHISCNLLILVFTGRSEQKYAFVILKLSAFAKVTFSLPNVIFYRIPEIDTARDHDKGIKFYPSRLSNVCSANDTPPHQRIFITSQRQECIVPCRARRRRCVHISTRWSNSWSILYGIFEPNLWRKNSCLVSHAEWKARRYYTVLRFFFYWPAAASNQS